MLMGIMLALATSAAPARPYAHQVVHDQCLIFAADPKNPWALAHGITGLGANFVAADGRKASVVVMKDFLQRNLLPDGGPGVGAPFGFARYAKDGTPVEPHTNLQAKTLVLAGVPLSTSYDTTWGKVSLAELVESVKKSYRHVPQSVEYWHDVGWTLDLFSHVMTPSKATFVNGAGETIDLNKVMDDALSELEIETRDLSDAIAKGTAMVPKRKQGLYGHPCGGLHFVQAVFGWARFPEVRKKWGPRLDAQIAVFFYRLDSERQQYDAALEQGGNQYQLQVLTQMLKFYGHFLETAGRLKTENQLKPTKEQTQSVAKAKAYLDQAVRKLEAANAFTTMEAIKKSQPQIYLDLIGDACHATHGWDLWP